MSITDYSKWNHIEVSDDEDDTHPNIDTPSLFRWRHQARVERDAQWHEEKSAFEKEARTFNQRLEKAKAELKQASQDNDQDRLNKAKKAISELENEEIKINEKRAELEKKEKLRPLNVDTISKEGNSKTIINKDAYKAPVQNPQSEEDQIERLREFFKKNDDLIKKFSMLRKAEDSLTFLLENPMLVCEETANRLVLWCVDLAVEEKFSLMEHVSHQCIVMQFMLELAKSLKIDPRNVIRPFFAKFSCPEPEYQAAFNDELTAFRERVRKRAQARIEEAMAELEEEERKKRLGPGGLDPVEVLESLPPELRACFENKDISKLQEVIQTLPIEEAKYHMERCVASGMWVPEKDDDDEENYQEIDSADIDNLEQLKVDSKCVEEKPEDSNVAKTEG